MFPICYMALFDCLTAFVLNLLIIFVVNIIFQNYNPLYLNSESLVLFRPPTDQNLGGNNLGASRSPWADFIENKHPLIALATHAKSKYFSTMHGFGKVL